MRRTCWTIRKKRPAKLPSIAFRQTRESCDRTLVEDLGNSGDDYAAGGQFRMNAASPATQTLSESHSLYPMTLGGEMEPTQRAAFCHARTPADYSRVWSGPAR
jgi:hypothetical protein